MSEKFQPQTFDINSINGGKRYQNGYGVTAESINSAIEASAFAQSIATNQPDITDAGLVGNPSVSITNAGNGTPRLKFSRLRGQDGITPHIGENGNWWIGEVDTGVKAQGEKGDMSNYYTKAETDAELAVLYNALAVGGIVYKVDTESEYSERITADGLPVLDGSKAVLKKVVGNTGIDGTELVNSSFAGIESTGKNIFDTSFIQDTTYANGSSVKNNGDGTITVVKKAGDRINIGTSKYLPQGTYNLSDMTGNRSGVFVQVSNDKTMFATASFATVSRTFEAGYVDFILYSEKDIETTAILTPQLEVGNAATEFEPYIKSEITFPKTEMPLGKTIDFESGKITDYGVRLVLTGNEDWKEYTPASGSAEEGYFVAYMGLKQPSLVPEDIDKVVCPDFPYKPYGYASPKSGGCISVSSLGSMLFIKTNNVSTVEELKELLADAYYDDVPYTIHYVSATLQSETTFAAKNKYLVWKNGMEIVLGNDGAEYETHNMLTQNYIVEKE